MENGAVNVVRSFVRDAIYCHSDTLHQNWLVTRHGPSSGLWDDTGRQRQRSSISPHGLYAYPEKRLDRAATRVVALRALRPGGRGRGVFL